MEKKLNGTATHNTEIPHDESGAEESDPFQVGGSAINLQVRS